MIKNYEIMYILRSKLGDAGQKEKIKNINQILVKNKIELVKTDELGLKDFAYKIKKEKNGYYVVTKFLSEPSFLDVFERILRFDNDILRYLIVKDRCLKNTDNINDIKDKDKNEVEKK